MRAVFVIGAFSTRFGKHADTSYKDLTREAYEGVLADAALQDGRPIEMAWFGNCGLHTLGQGSIRGQVCFSPLVESGRFPERVPMINVEDACATSSAAFHGAWKDILSGQSECSLAIGVEKLVHPDPAVVKATFDGGIDQLDPGLWQDYYRRAGAAAGKAFEPGPGRTIFMDTYAMQACHHMKRHGTTLAQIAASAAKNHTHAVENDKAQYRFAMTVEQVLADRPVTHPFTRAMCAPMGDGAAAALLCSADFLAGLDGRTRDRAVKVRASAFAGGKYRSLDEPGLSRIAADKAYKMAGIGPDEIDLAEVHDATSFCEIYQAEMLRFCPEGQGGAYVASGAATLGGERPINVSGGLVSKGHPVGATGLSMIEELTRQLRGEAGKRQVKGARLALAENGGGVMGFDEAACAVTILERA
ncbi:MAG: thiolase family protein [Alphaproteobacteria bacterium]|nr:thiolase family protein [Alphaproteobacteria bacterium]